MKRATAIKRAMATDSDTMGNGHGKEGDGHSMTATRGMA
jgi:hypothetical protein